MEKKINLRDKYQPSENIVARELEGELIIIPLSSNVGDIEDELYTLNPTGHSIWRYLDGKKTVGQIIKLLAEEFSADSKQIQNDVTGLIRELHQRKFLIKIDH